MIAFPPGVRGWLATGHTDMRKRFPIMSMRPPQHRQGCGST
jgi:hypothetical protein